MLLLARVVTRIGDVTEITPELVEDLYAADFDHLQRLYERINTDGEAVGAVTCPHCSHAVRGRPHGDRGRAPGGMTRPSPAELFAETARLAHHFHWPLDTILDLEHPDRRRFLREADALAGYVTASRTPSTEHMDENLSTTPQAPASARRLARPRRPR